MLRVDRNPPCGGVAKPGTPLDWVRARPYLTAFLVGAAVMSVPTLRRGATEFEWSYVFTARNLVNGWGIYRLARPPFWAYTYPPFMAAMSVPFALLPHWVSRVAWYLVTVLSVAFIWRGSWSLSGGGRLEGGGLIDRKEHRVALWGLACALPYLQSGVAHQQTDPLIIGLVVAGCLALERSRALGAATCFGVAAGMKCTPLLWAPYLAWRGRWRAAVWLVAVAVGVNLLPDLIHAPQGGGCWLGRWFEYYLRPMGHPDYLPGRWYASILDNQSLSGTVLRWAATRPAWRAGLVEIAARVHPPDPQVLRRVILGLEGVVLLVAWLALRRRPAPGRSAGGPGAPRGAIEYSVVMLLMVLFSPMSSRPHFGVMLLPALCLARSAIFEGHRAPRVLLFLSAATSIAALPCLGRDAGRLSMWCGMLTWGAAFLLAGCLAALLSDGRYAGRFPRTPKLARSAVGKAHQRSGT